MVGHRFSRDGAGLRLAAHTLKGTVRFFAGTPAQAMAFEMEKMGQEGNFTGAQEAFPALDGELARLTPVLVDYVKRATHP